jgi:UDP-4-amino-4,6-dideoxy-N-acetyl-beta-L-altrosamine transaminase
MSDIKYSYGRQSISEEDIEAVVKALRSDWLTQGPEITKFETALCDRFGAGYASAAANGTAGLHLIALASGWGPGDIVITSPITFLATANCIAYAGARPDFVDIDPRFYTLDPTHLETKLKAYAKQGKKVKAVIGVDYAGHPCDWDAIKSLSEKYGFQMVNDNCHALGASYKGDKQYAVKYASSVNMSFHPVKHITTGEGGAVLTNDAELDKKIKILRTHGITKDPDLLVKNDGPWYYEMQHLGFNYRITDFQCALGTSQLSRLDDFVSKRRKVALLYAELLSSDDRLVLPAEADYAEHSYHLYPLQIDFEKCKISKELFFEGMRDKGIALQVHYIPIHLQPYYRENYGFRKGNFPISEEFYNREVSLPIYPSLESMDIDFIAKNMLEALDGMDNKNER